MKVAAAVICALLGAFLAEQAAAAPYWTGSSSGWFWYERPQPLADVAPEPITPDPEPPEEETAEKPPPQYEEEAELPQLAQHRKLQEQLEQLRIIAIMSPTPANLEAYMRIQREAVDRAAAFAQAWQRVLWTNPDLDFSVQGRPTNAAALYSYEAERMRDRADLLASASSAHGLFFVYGPECLHCAQMGAALQRFAEAHGMNVQGVAVGAADVAAFPGSWADNGFAAASGVPALPAVLLARLDGSYELQPVAFGPLSDDELARRVALLIEAPEPGVAL